MNSSLAKLQRSPRDLARWQKAQQQLLGGRPRRTGTALCAVDTEEASVTSLIK
jgi:hypothetical protein